MLPLEKVTIPKYKENHCYSDNGEFDPRIIRIGKVGQREYLYQFKLEYGLWSFNYYNNISTIESVYPNEVICEKK